MEKRVLICLDGRSLQDPSLVGLDDMRLNTLPWLLCETSAERCRASALSEGLEEVWVVSCDDMEPINVAAALKRDDSDKKVFLVSEKQSGSFASRATNAGIDGLWSQASFVRHFVEAKAKHSLDGIRSDGNPLSCRRSSDSAPLPLGGFGSHSDGAQHIASKESSGSSAAALKGKLHLSEDASIESRALHAACVAKGTEEKSARAYETKGAPVKEGPGTVMAVVAGSGGCGKSTISSVIAFLAARAGMRTVVFDADLQFGDMDYLLGIQDPLHMEEVMQDPARLADVDVQADGKTPALVAAPRRMEVSELVAAEVAPMVFALKKSFDLVVVNTGALWADAHAGVLEAADAVVFAMDSRPSSLRATVHAVELCARLGVATTAFTFVVNKHEKTSLLSAVDVSCALRGAQAVEFPNGGRDVDELLGAGYADELLDSKNAFVESVKRMLAETLPPKRAEMLDARAVRGKKKGSFFGRGGK